LQTKFQALKHLNSNKFDPFEYTDYVMISVDFDNLDDLHKAIKYGILTME